MRHDLERLKNCLLSRHSGSTWRHTGEKVSQSELAGHRSSQLRLGQRLKRGREKKEVWPLASSRLKSSCDICKRKSEVKSLVFLNMFVWMCVCVCVCVSNVRRPIVFPLFPSSARKTWPLAEADFLLPLFWKKSRKTISNDDHLYVYSSLPVFAPICVFVWRCACIQQVYSVHWTNIKTMRCWRENNLIVSWISQGAFPHSAHR